MAIAVGASSSSESASSRSSAPSAVVSGRAGGCARARAPGHAAVAPVTVTRKAADRPLSATVAPSTTNEASSIVWAPGVIAGIAAAAGGRPARQPTARDVGELDASAVDVGGVAKGRELARARSRPDSSRVVRCRKCARRCPPGSDVEGGGGCRRRRTRAQGQPSHNSAHPAQPFHIHSNDSRERSASCGPEPTCRRARLQCTR